MASKINFQLTANAKQWIAGLTAGQKALSQFANLQNKTVLATNTLTKGLGFYTKALIHNQKITLRAAGGLKAYADAIKKTTFTIKSRTNAGATMFRTLQREASANNKVTRSVERQNAAYARMAARTRAGAMQTVPTRPVGFAAPAPATQGPPSAPAGSIRAGEIKSATKSLRAYQAQAKATVAANQRLSGSFGNLKFMLTTLFVGIGLHQFKKITDEAGQLNNRILVVSRSAEEFNQQFAKVTKIAKDTRADLRSTAVLYSRLSIATKRLGFDQDQVALATQNLSKMMAIQGVSQHEARSAVLQLSQALQSGRLAGDEFRAIQEIMPALLGDIARATGHPIEALKDLARQGKITPVVIMDALLDNTEKINFMFNQTKITVGQMGIQIRNSFVRIFAVLQKNDGAASSLSKVYIRIAEAFEFIAEAIGTVITLFLYLDSLFPSLNDDISALSKENEELAKKFLESNAALGPLSRGLKMLGVDVKATDSFFKVGTKGLAAFREEMLEQMEAQERQLEAARNAKIFFEQNGITYTKEQLEEETKKLIAEMEKQEQATAKFRQAFEDLKTGLKLDDVAHNFETVTSQLREGAFKTLAEDFPRQFGDGIASVIVDGENFKDSMKNIFKNMAKQVIAQIVAIITQLIIMRTLMATFMPTGTMGAGFFGGENSILGNLGSGIRKVGKAFKKLSPFADGGRPMVGQPALVGERGPELFVPDQAGTIIPNEQMVGGIVIQNLNIMPGANIDAALTEKPMTYWVDLTQEKILPALNTLGQAGNTTTLQTREPR
tara:strand:+ start:827 stop:3175 length:2349 start_codon:yes stop_codon:yes gene_type:complete